MKLSTLLGIGLAACLTTAQWAGAASWSSVDGKTKDPLHNLGQKAAVLFFVSADCPNCNGYFPEFNRIVKAYGAQHVAFYVVHEDDDMTKVSAKKHASDYGYSVPVVLDPQHALAKTCKVTITPEVAVLDPAGHELYHGRIDDRYTYCGSSARQTTTDLRDALSAIVAGRAVAHAEEPAKGCAIFMK